jgi:hypothetical protein
MAQYLLTVANTHGRTEVLKILEKFGVRRLPDLKFSDVERFHEELRALERTDPCGQAPTQLEWETHAKQYPNAHRGMKWRIDRIRRGEAPPRPVRSDLNFDYNTRSWKTFP